ncbi:MAG: hypothetical protein M0Z91_10035, partial [Actinomycetota bacterium]|nr:hypothetical protein [Actinomycetota bacterium]
DRSISDHWAALYPTSAYAAWMSSVYVDSIGWPPRLFEVDVLPTAPAQGLNANRKPVKRNTAQEGTILAVERLKVVAEIPAHRICGRFGAQVFAFIDRLLDLSQENWLRILGAPRPGDGSARPIAYQGELARALDANLRPFAYHLQLAGWGASQLAASVIEYRVHFLGERLVDNGTQARLSQVKLAAKALTLPDKTSPALFDEILAPFVGVMGDAWFRSAADIAKGRITRANRASRLQAPPLVMPPAIRPSPSTPGTVLGAQPNALGERSLGL